MNLKTIKKLLSDLIHFNQPIKKIEHELIMIADQLIEYEKCFEKKIADVLFWLSSQDINGKLSIKKAEAYISYLERSGH